MAIMDTTPRQQKVMHVVSPCEMQAGFTFMAEHEDSIVRVIVPSGGVKEGETIEVPLPQDPKIFASEVTPLWLRGSKHFQTGWKSPLFDCFRYGFCHSHVTCALFCPQILLAQVLTRQKMNWLGRKAPDHEWKHTFRIILALVVVYWTLMVMLVPPSPMLMFDSEGHLVRLPNQQFVHPFQLFLYHSISWVFGAYTVMLLVKLRRSLRREYHISESFSGQDLCLSVCCGTCLVGQMARQSCDYETEPSACCSSTGVGVSAGRNPSFLV